MKRVLATCLVLLAGCLGDLVKPAGEDGGLGGSDGGSADAAVATDIDIRITTLVTDLDGNGFPDLVLLNDAPVAAKRSVMVYFDQLAGFFGEPSVVLSTDSLHPLVATTWDFQGGAPLDLMVMARDDDGVPYVLLFKGDGARGFTLATSQGFPGEPIEAGTVAMPAPVFATRTFIRDSAAAPPGLVFGDRDGAFYVSTTDWTTISADDDVPLASGSGTMGLIVPVTPTGADRNDLLVLDEQGAIWMQNDGSVSGGFDVGSQFPDLWPDDDRLFLAFDPLYDATSDFMTIAGGDLRVGEVEWDVDQFTVSVRQLDPSPSLGDDRAEAIFAADIDGIGGIDLLVLDDVEPPANDPEHFMLLAARNLKVVDESTISPDSGLNDIDRSHLGNPTRLIAGDFDGEGTAEVWVFDQTLDFKMCLRGEIYQTNKMRFNECP